VASSETNQAGASIIATSNHWSGYLIKDTSQADVRGVFGSWKVQTVVCTKTRSASSVTWVGIGGAVAPDASTTGDETLYQTGTESLCANGEPEYVAFVEDFGTPNDIAATLGKRRVNPRAVILGCPGRLQCSTELSVDAGDVITAAVVDHSLYTRWTITDARDGSVIWSHTNTWITHAHRHSAECIEEDPLVGVNAEIGTLADFGKVTFTSCRVSDSSGRLWDADSPTLPNGWNETVMSMVQGGLIVAKSSEDSYTVTWNGSPTTTTTLITTTTEPSATLGLKSTCGKYLKADYHSRLTYIELILPQLALQESAANWVIGLDEICEENPPTETVELSLEELGWIGPFGWAPT
jgi:hypothetical protein